MVSAAVVDLVEKYRRRENTMVHVLRGGTTEKDSGRRTTQQQLLDLHVARKSSHFLLNN
jgi:hypothetical protein